MNKKERKFNTLFVSIAVIALVFLIGFYLIVTIKTLNKQQALKLNQENEDQYFLNKDFEYSNDSYITKNPNLADMLAGPIISKNDPQTGDSKAFVSIVEFSDFECNYCAKQEQVLKKVLEKYHDKARLIWKDYPDKNVNSTSYQSAIAGRCAQEQNMFWSYHNLLFNSSSNNNLNNEEFIKIAKLLNLNISKFKKCLKSEIVKEKINDNIKEANALQITGIPFFYVNDVEIMGEINEKELGQLIEIQLSEL